MTPSQLKRFLASTIAARRPVMVKGAPGIGKSDVIDQAAEDAGADSEEFTSEDLPIELHPAGGGGTSFAPAIEHVDQLDEIPAALLYFTDMQGTFPDHAPEYPVLWLNYGYPKTIAPFGDTISLAE